jgi:hypothetical protein
VVCDGKPWPTVLHQTCSATRQHLCHDKPVISDPLSLELNQVVLPRLEWRAPDVGVEFHEPSLTALPRGAGPDAAGDNVQRDGRLVRGRLEQEIVFFG